MITTWILSAILLVLAVVHFYWALGGGWGTGAVIPIVDGKPTFEPGPLATTGVGVLLLLAAGITAAQGGLLGMQRSGLTRLGVWILAVVFALRMIGDFRLIGLFKRVRETPFARLDSRLYSPLCGTISGLCCWLLHISKP